MRPDLHLRRLQRRLLPQGRGGPGGSGGAALLLLSPPWLLPPWPHLVLLEPPVGRPGRSLQGQAGRARAGRPTPADGPAQHAHLFRRPAQNSSLCDREQVPGSQAAMVPVVRRPAA